MIIALVLPFGKEKIMKKISVLLMLLLFSISFIFASGNSETMETASTGLKIAIVTTPSGVDDGSFNENNYDGCLAFVNNHPGASVTPLRDPSVTGANAIKLVKDIVSDYDVEVCCGYQFASITQIAKDNPNTNFILVDTFPIDNEVLSNVYAMMFAEQESGFFAGMAAALETKTGKVAIMNGVAYPSNVNYQYGFECGVKYANAKYDSKVECVEILSHAGIDVTGANIGGNYVKSFGDEITGKTIASQLIAKGVDVLFVAAGDSGKGAFAAAKSSNGRCKIIGVDVDQWEEGQNGKDNIILTSVLKNMAPNVERVLNEINDGTFVGENALLTAKTDSTGYVKEAGHNQLKADTIAKLDSAYILIKDGTIVPASNFGVQPDDFKIN